ncbi:hypothetical protein B0T25DRAFT_293932 [Lasiosphaeria hispida]|uniref:Nucleoside phosphorylase domain-containing protein n=1 Tax=Lasiosphaeria hispida TaxID=260671 RepID=A0AAJ0MBA5_9PEZI|nr:hypothetical protein B0T25DRAFT_293932 [Lasiosphaeria hispida]
MALSVVPQRRATLLGRTSIGIHANHIDMTKFATVEDAGFRAVYRELERWINKLNAPQTHGKPKPTTVVLSTALSQCGCGTEAVAAQPYQNVPPMGYSHHAVIANTANSPPAGRLDASSFTIAIFCALKWEADAVAALFNHCYDDEGVYTTINNGDINGYSFGRIRSHNVVLVHLGGMGKVNASGAARSCRSSFRNLELFLVVGVCGAVPKSRGRDILLGDVIVSNSIVQYDFGRQYAEGFKPKEEAKRSLHADLRSQLAQFESNQGLTQLQQNTARYMDRNEKPPIAEQGYRSPAVHLGRVASGDTVMKSKENRNKIVQEFDDVVAFEMEGAAIWDQGLPCLVVKGVSDHADVEKTKDWQRYAAAAAAACTRAILDRWQPLRQATSSPNAPKHQPQGPWFLVPHPENTNFTRRKTVNDELDGMIETFITQQPRPKDRTRIALHGGPGVGKSQIALACAYELQRKRPDISIFWVPAASAEKFRQAFVSIAKECQISGDESFLMKDPLWSVKSWLEKKHHGPWLMIIDNADEKELFFPSKRSGNKSPARPILSMSNQAKGLGSYIPNCPQGAILFTTRFRDLGLELTKNASWKSCITVPKLDPNESARLLGAELGNVDATEQELKDLSERLDKTPFALIQATSYIQKNSITSIGQFLDDLNRASVDELVELLSEGVDTWGREEDAPRSIVEMYLLSFQDVQQKNSFAGDCLLLMSLFDREDIPREFLAIFSKRRLEKESIGMDLTQALGLLINFSLIKPDSPNEFDMHRLEQILTQRWLHQQGLTTKRFFETEAILTMLEAFPSDSHEELNRSKYSRYLPHVRAVLELEGNGSEDEKRAKISLLERAAMLLLYQRQWEDGGKFLDDAKILRQEVLGTIPGLYPESKILTTMCDLLVEYESSKKEKQRSKGKSGSKEKYGLEMVKKHMPEDMMTRATGKTRGSTS